MSTTYKALILSAHDKPLSLETLPIPVSEPGAAVVKILATTLLPYSRSVYTHETPYPMSLPLVPGNAAIARVHSVSSDAVSLTPGQLVFLTPYIVARDDPAVSILLGLNGMFTPASQKLMSDAWRNGTLAEYSKVPLENCFPLNEQLLTGTGKGQLGYSISDICHLGTVAVPFGGLADADVKVGETVIVAPATGRFGGAAVQGALALGARVVACGRSRANLDNLVSVFGDTGRLETVVLDGGEGDAERLQAVVGAGADAYIDFSPAVAAGSGHIATCLGALKRGGQAVFQGGIFGGVEIPYGLLMVKSLKIHGRFMYEREDIVRLVKMLETGAFSFGKKGGIETFGPYGLDKIEEALDAAAEKKGFGQQVVVMP